MYFRNKLSAESLLSTHVYLRTYYGPSACLRSTGCQRRIGRDRRVAFLAMIRSEIAAAGPYLRHFD